MQGFRFGKHPPKTDYRTLRFKDYVGAELAPPPPSFNVLDQVYANLETKDPTSLFPMDGNDRLGDCTIAALAHAVTVYRGLVKHRHLMAEHSVTKLYMHLTSGIDSGLNELDVLGYWRKHSVTGDKIFCVRQGRPEKSHACSASDPAVRRRLYRLPGARELRRAIQRPSALDTGQIDRRRTRGLRRRI